jgi:predicted membrane protein
MDLSGLQVSGLGVETGVGSITVRLPQGVSVQGQVKTAIGQVTLIVPEGAGVRIQLDRALSAIRFPAGYVRVGNVYTSPNYETAEYKIDLTVGAAIGVITVK